MLNKSLALSGCLVALGFQGCLQSPTPSSEEGPTSSTAGPRNLESESIATGADALAATTPGTINYRSAMRNFVRRISAYAKERRPGFQIVVNNAMDLYTFDGNPTGSPAAGYLAAIDGANQESLNFGYNGDNTATPSLEKSWLLKYMDVPRAAGKKMLVIDYCYSSTYIASSLSQNTAKGFLTYTAPSRSLNRIPTIAVPNAHAGDVATIKAARNFLDIVNPSGFSGKSAFLTALRATNYDAIVIDPWFAGAHMTAADIASLKRKANGGRRIVLAYMSIGEAEDYRAYWKDAWSSTPPSWLGPENPDWPGNYKVKYWNAGWQAIIYGNSSSSLDRMLAAEFDGTFLDVVDAYQYWENPNGY